MNKRIFTQEQIEELSKNVHVWRCSEKSVTYCGDFKVLAVKRYEAEGIPPSQIFKEAGFDVSIIGKDVPDDRMYRWRKVVKTKGIQGLATESRGKAGRGGRPKTKNLTDADTIERLEATVAYLKAENDFLAKLRAKRRE